MNANEVDFARGGGMLDGLLAARRIVANSPYFRGRADTFEFFQYDRVLLVRGQVPSFYLKQVLQTLLRELPGVERVDDRVTVVSASGLSSESRD
jgi:hypothetical protein